MKQLVVLSVLLEYAVRWAAEAARVFCPVDMYYDAVTRNCASCRDICDNARMQKTDELCDDECPGYGNSLILPAVTSLPTDATSGPKSGPDSSKNTVVIAVCLSIVVVVVVVAVVCYKVDSLRQKILSSFRGLFCIQQNQNEFAVEQHPDGNNTHQPQENGGACKIVPSCSTSDSSSAGQAADNEAPENEAADNEAPGNEAPENEEETLLKHSPGGSSN